jgi:hypothetical protein
VDGIFGREHELLVEVCATMGQSEVYEKHCWIAFRVNESIQLEAAAVLANTDHVRTSWRREGRNMLPTCSSLTQTQAAVIRSASKDIEVDLLCMLLPRCAD